LLSLNPAIAGGTIMFPKNSLRVSKKYHIVHETLIMVISYTLAEGDWIYPLSTEKRIKYLGNPVNPV
jgi:hypothetical protein